MSAADRKTVTLPLDVYEQLKAEATIEDLTLVQMVRRALRVHAIAAKYAAIYGEAQAETEDVSS